MNLGPSAVIFIEHIGPGDGHVGTGLGRSLVGPRADAVIVRARGRLRGLAGCAARTVGRHDLYDEPSVASLTTKEPAVTTAAHAAATTTRRMGQPPLFRAASYRAGHIPARCRVPAPPPSTRRPRAKLPAVDVPTRLSDIGDRLLPGIERSGHNESPHATGHGIGSSAEPLVVHQSRGSRLREGRDQLSRATREAVMDVVVADRPRHPPSAPGAWPRPAGPPRQLEKGG